MKSTVKYELADKLAPHFENLAHRGRGVAFGVVLNAQIRLNGKLTSLKDSFSPEDAFHITNLVLCRITNNKIIEVEIGCDEED